VTVIHESPLTAVHEHGEAIVTAIVPPDAPAPTDAFTGERVAAQEMPACVTVSVCPATVTVPVRGLVDVFAATL